MRTIIFLGKAYSKFGNVHMRIKINGRVYGVGDVPTINGEPPTKNESFNYEELMRCQVPREMEGNVHVGFEVYGGDVIVVGLSGKRINILPDGSEVEG